MEVTGFVSDKTMGISQEVLAVLIVPLPNRWGLSCRCLITFPTNVFRISFSVHSDFKAVACICARCPKQSEEPSLTSNLLGEGRW